MNYNVELIKRLINTYFANYYIYLRFTWEEGLQKKYLNFYKQKNLDKYFIKLKSTNKFISHLFKVIIYNQFSIW